MNRYILLISLCVTTLFTQSAMAEGYYGIKGGIYQFKNSAVKTPANVGLFFGADVFEMGSNPVAIEADINTSLIKGKTSGYDFSLQTSALYMALRTDKEDFFKAKIGLHSTTGKVGSFSSTKDNALSYGIGFGIGGYEIEYTILKAEKNTDDDYSLITIGYRFM